MRDSPSIRSLRSIFLFAAGLAVLAGCPKARVSNANGGSTASVPVLVQHGGSLPSASTFAAKASDFNGGPFHGAVVNGTLLFRHVAYPDSVYASDQVALASFSSTQLGTNYLRVLGTAQTGWDWFSDSDWAATDTNLHNLAMTAKAGNFVGISFDPEPYESYGFNPWDFAQQPGASTHTFVEVQVQVRLRGKQLIQRLQTDLPRSQLLSLGWLSFLRSLIYDTSTGTAVPRTSVDPEALKQHTYGLLAAFLNGILDGIDPGMTLIDGDEGTYDNQEAAEFDDQRTLVTQDALILVDPANRAKYRAQVRVGMAVYLDQILALGNSSYPVYLGYYLASDEERQQYLLHNAYHALRTSDGIVWVYSDGQGGLDWWNSAVPAVIPETLSRALELQGQPLGFEFAPIRAAALARKLVLSGQILNADSTAIQGATVQATTSGGTDRIYCTSSDASGQYDCYIKSGWSGALRPAVTGKTFSPQSRTYGTQTSSLGGQDFKSN